MRIPRIPPRPSAVKGTAAKGTGRRRRAKKKPTGLRRFFTWKKVLAYAFSVCALLGGAFAVLYYSVDIPKANDQAKAQSNVYKYSDGTILTRTGEINRESVSIDRIPKAVQDAFVAAENQSFYSDSGVAPMGIIRGLVNTVSGKGAQGGSTITQQYVKNYYLSQEQTVTRKAKELVIALKIDQSNSKSDILAGYLNTSYFGRVAYGVQAAARAYYGKDVEDLTVEEGAYLAALVQAPSQYDWAVAGPKARRMVAARWTYVLDNMVEMGRLKQADRERMVFPEPITPEAVPGLDGQAGYLVDAARAELIASGVSEQELAAGGWTITLNVDPRRQNALRDSVELASKGASANTQTGAVSVDPRTGGIVALYGGRDYTKHYISNATRTDYQAGAAFKPIALASAMENGMPLRPALPGRLPEPLGLDPALVKKTAVALGMDPDATGFTARRQTVSLGLMGTSPLELAEVYATIGGGGRKVTPALVKSARRGDERARLADPFGGQAISPKDAESVTALQITDSSNVLEPLPVGNDTPVAVKTAETSGTSDDGKAAWHIAYDSNLVTAVGVFGENAKTQKQMPLENATTDGVGRAGAIWNMYMKTGGLDEPGPADSGRSGGAATAAAP